MLRQKKYKIIGAFLLIVFSLNTVTGFACSLGVDMGYNSKHHEHDKSNPFSHGKLHSHIASDHDKQHHHDNSTSSQNSPGSKDDCCANEVTKFAQLDKSVANQLQLHAPVFIKIFPDFYSLALQPEQSISINSNFQFVRRSCSLYNIDIRIAIQSFQI